MRDEPLVLFSLAALAGIGGFFIGVIHRSMSPTKFVVVFATVTLGIFFVGAVVDWSLGGFGDGSNVVYVAMLMGVYYLSAMLAYLLARRTPRETL